MTYKLRFWLSWLNPNRYESLLKNEEMVRGLFHECVLHVMNVGDEKFIGGQVSNISVNYSTHTSHYALQNNIMPSLEKNEESVFSFSLIPNQEGWAWVKFTVTTSDKKPVSYFQTSNPIETPSSDLWQNGIFILNREKLDIILSIKELEKKLNKSKTPTKKVRKVR